MASPRPVDQGLYFYANERQREVLQLIEKHGSHTAAAKVLGIRQHAVSTMYKRLEQHAARRGYVPNQDISVHVPAGYRLKGQSLLLDADGKIIQQWAKTEADKAQTDVISDLMEEWKDGIKPFKPVNPPKHTDTDLLTCYTITDYHIGAYSWHSETGGDWDIKIAEQVLMTAIGDMIRGAPASKEAVFCQLGDFLHWDGLAAVTPTSKHLVDADTRYHLLVKIASECCFRAVEMLAAKHEVVHVKMCEGNHDLAGSVWLQRMMQMLFRDNPRIVVDESAFPYYTHVFGDVFLGFHHGHLSKIRQMPGKFWSEFGELMGPCKWRFLHTGHLHTKEVIEASGVVVERHPTLNQRDAYGARGFDKTIRAAQAITYHRALGEVGRNLVYPRHDIKK